MEKLDKLVLAKFQKFADWFQSWFGKNNFFLAKITLLFWFLLCCTNIDANNTMSIALINCEITSFIVLCFLTFTLLMDERTCMNNKQFKNPAESNFVFVRCIYLISWLLAFSLLIGGLLDAKELFGSILWYTRSSMVFVAVYLSACTPKPPSKSKFKKLVEKAKERASQVFSPQPALTLVRLKK